MKSDNQVRYFQRKVDGQTWLFATCQGFQGVFLPPSRAQSPAEEFEGPARALVGNISLYLRECEEAAATAQAEVERVSGALEAALSTWKFQSWEEEPS
ncbi:MAG: hypothetical protein GY871_04155 [Actinomycetales bacterium]|nr:hypothetical protein [Actinomycetales bacterium]